MTPPFRTEGGYSSQSFAEFLHAACLLDYICFRHGCFHAGRLHTFFRDVFRHLATKRTSKVNLWHPTCFAAVLFLFLSPPFLLPRGSSHIDVRNHSDVFIPRDILNHVVGPQSRTAAEEKRCTMSGDSLIEAFIPMPSSPALHRYWKRAAILRFTSQADMILLS